MSNSFQKSELDAQPNTLIREAQAGDQTAFEKLLDRYAPLIDSQVRHFVGGATSVQDHEDFRQEAILAFYRALMHYDTAQDKIRFGLFAKTCIRNRLISYLRSQKQRENEILLEDEQSLELTEDISGNPASHMMEQEDYETLYRLISASLSDYENRIWWLYLSGRTVKEIAAQNEKDEKSVQNAIYRIRRKLREIIPNPT